MNGFAPHWLAALVTSAAMNALLAIEMLIGNCEET
jgi:hypothetical protein